MRNPLCQFLIAAVAAIPVSAAVAAPGDTPVSSQGGGGPAPRAEIAATISPSLGTGSTSTTEIQARGASIPAPQPFPSNGLATVAYGSVGKRGESIINWDARTRSYTKNYPSRAIVFIEYNGGHYCSGFLYAQNMVATAGHCVHTGGSSGAWLNMSLLKVYAGRDGTASPYGFCTVTRLRSVLGWTQSKNFRYDYGAMRLNCNIGNTVGWFGMYTHTSPVNQPAIIGGYPGDKPRDQWTGADKIRASSTEMLAYRIDTVGGQSGSPVWHDKDEATASNGAWAIGVHNYGVGAFGTNTNASARLTGGRIQNYISWRDAP